VFFCYSNVAVLLPISTRFTGVISAGIASQRT
ncbi:uncharacterized protein METZ01_LOCUS455270, partial [marine metagenome]